MTYSYTDISLGEFPGEVSLILYNQNCINRCPWCFNPELIKGKNLTWKQIKDAIDEHEDFISSVVFSGGEPLLIPHLRKSIRYCKDKGLKVKINTCGYVDEARRKNIFLPHVSYMNISLKGLPNMYDIVSRKSNIQPIILNCDTLEYSFVYSPTLWPKKILERFHIFLEDKISFDWKTMFSDRWSQPDIFTVSQIQTGDCLDDSLNYCSVPSEQQCIDVARIFKNIPRKKIIVETKEYGRKSMKKDF